MDNITGQDLIDYIKKHKLEKADVKVSAMIEYDGDHNNLSTEHISLFNSDNMLNIYIGDTLE